MAVAFRDMGALAENWTPSPLLQAIVLLLRASANFTLSQSHCYSRAPLRCDSFVIPLLGALGYPFDAIDGATKSQQPSKTCATVCVTSPARELFPASSPQ
jgi:hypothetical protein